MEQCDKVILFGYLDGYTYELNGITNYIVALETGERVEIPVGGVMGVDEFVEKDKIKLKDVIARIKKLDLGTQKVWLNEILNELGSDYGTLKYKAGYEQGKLEGEWVYQQLKDADKIRQEINKPVVPQFVADWLEYCKNTSIDLSRALYVRDVDFYNFANQKDFLGLRGFFETEQNQELFARAWLDGYTIEEEKRYRVKLKGINSESECLYYGMGSNTWSFRMKHESGYFRRSHTRKELEKSGFGWVFDCPGIEIEEVEG